MCKIYCDVCRGVRKLSCDPYDVDRCKSCGSMEFRRLTRREAKLVIDLNSLKSKGLIGNV